MNLNNIAIGPFSVRCCHPFPGLLETDTDICFHMNVQLTVVILLSWLFAISAFCAQGDVIVTWNMGSHRKPSSDPLSQGVQVMASPTHKHYGICWNVINSHKLKDRYETTFHSLTCTRIFYRTTIYLKEKKHAVLMICYIYKTVKSVSWTSDSIPP